jgi:hypothetical protein
MKVVLMVDLTAQKKVELMVFLKVEMLVEGKNVL